MGLVNDVQEISQQSELKNFRLVGHSDLNGCGDGMQLIKHENFLYLAHLGVSDKALTILDVSDPTNPKVLNQMKRLPNTHAHKVQINGDILIQNQEFNTWDKEHGDEISHQAGLLVYDITNRVEPKEIAFHKTAGEGVHRIWFQEDDPYAHIATYKDGYRTRGYSILDLSEPTKPKEVGFWWVPGTKEEENEGWEMLPGDRFFEVHGVIPYGDRAYVGCLDAGMVILDIKDMSNPRFISRAHYCPPFGGFTHTAMFLPERKLVVCADEATSFQSKYDDKRIWLIDVREEKNPVIISTFPHPEGDFIHRPLRFGPHNLHEHRKGAFYSENLIFSTYFNAGLRVHDIRDQFRPVEIASFLPPTPSGQEAIQINDLYVDEDHFVYITDRYNGGLYVLEYTGPVF